MKPRIFILKGILEGVLAGVLCCAALGACSDNQPVTVEYYQPSYRTSPPDPVYNRLTWSHLPAPMRPKATAETPEMLPQISFELGEATLDEAIESLAQTMGYRWHYSKGLAKRPIKIKMEGTVEEVLREIGRQARVEAMFDHEKRLIIVVEGKVQPRLPGT